MDRFHCSGLYGEVVLLTGGLYREVVELTVTGYWLGLRLGLFPAKRLK